MQLTRVLLDGYSDVLKNIRIAPPSVGAMGGKARGADVDRFRF
jgi:hypothetical protein